MRVRKIFALLLAIALILPLSPKYQVNANDSFSLYILEEDADTLRLMWSSVSMSGYSIEKFDIQSATTIGNFNPEIIDILYDLNVTSFVISKPTVTTYYQLKIYCHEDGTGNAIEVFSEIAMYDPLPPLTEINKPDIYASIYDFANDEIVINWSAFVRPPLTSEEALNTITSGHYAGQYIDRDVEYDIWITDDSALFDSPTLPQIATVSAQNLAQADMPNSTFEIQIPGYIAKFEQFTSMNGGSFENRTLVGDKTYFIKMVARHSIGIVSEAAFVEIHLPPADGGISELINLDVFKNLTVTDITSNSVTVKFDSAIDFRITEKADRYIMQYFVQKVDGDLPSPINVTVSVTGSTEAGYVGCYFTVTNLDPNTAYVLWLRGLDSELDLHAQWLLKSFNTGVSTGNIAFTVGSNVTATRGQTVTVPITVNNNPGFSAVGLAVTYDPNVLEIMNVTAPVSEMPLNSEFALTGTPGTQWIHLVNPVPADWNGNGVVVNITFNVKTTAALGISPISLAFTSSPDGTPGNVNGDILISATAISGSVNVASNVLYGDLNGDSIVDSADLILMLRYFAQPGTVINLSAADVNGDGTVNSADLILFLKYFAQPGIILGPQ